jgi:putative hydrolase of the HAD superfamily
MTRINKPKMIIFDYGQTLIREEPFNGVKGVEDVLAKCVINSNNISAEEVQTLANELNKDIGRYDPSNLHLCLTEVHNYPFQNYLYEYLGLTRTVSPLEVETTFWDAAAPGRPTANIVELLFYLENNHIRSSVISNISHSGQALEKRIKALLPQNNFEFIIASSEYVFRKPHKRIFEIATRKARLAPDEIWYCGDNAVCDVDGAVMAGLFPVWYKGTFEGYGATPQNECLIISDWMDLIKILEKTK